MPALELQVAHQAVLEQMTVADSPKWDTWRAENEAALVMVSTTGVLAPDWIAPSYPGTYGP